MDDYKTLAKSEQYRRKPRYHTPLYPAAGGALDILGETLAQFAG